MVAGFDYFADEFVEPYRPFFYQAYTEMGYYGYDLNEFKSWLNYASEPGFEYTLPKDVTISYDETISENLDKYIKNEADNFIFIYGEYDTWSATAVELGQNENSVVFYKKKGSHRSRVRNMPEEQQEEVKAMLDLYLGE